jgi:hypothetical protein
MSPLACPPCCLGDHSALEMSPPTPCARTRRLEREHREVRGKTQSYYPIVSYWVSAPNA